MKIIHMSDLHIGKTLINHSLLEDQKVILEKIKEAVISENPDAIVIAGDIYDKHVPSADAVSVFDNFITALSENLPETEIMVISGNHDSTQRMNIFRSILSSRKIHMVGVPPESPDEYIEKVTLHDEYGKVNFYLLPFIKPSYVKAITGDGLSYDEALHIMTERENIDTSERNVLVSHQFYVRCGEKPENIIRTDSETITVGNIDSVSADILDIFDYSALGHLHRPSCVNNEFQRYCGSPLAVSFSEEKQQKGIIAVEMKEKGNTTTSVITIEPLRKVKQLKGTFEEIMAHSATDDYISLEITDRAGMKKCNAHRELKNLFPNLLEIRMNNTRKNNYTEKHSDSGKQNDAFNMCLAFLDSATEQETAVIRDIINALKEEEI